MSLEKDVVGIISLELWFVVVKPCKVEGIHLWWMLIGMRQFKMILNSTMFKLQSSPLRKFKLKKKPMENNT